jgi:hypothetical protein
MQADNNWTEIDEGNDVIRLLQLIRNCEAQGQACRDPTQAMMEAQNNLMNFKQSQNMSNTEYFEVFQAKLETADLLHAAIREQAGRVAIELEEIAVDPDVPTNEEREQARTAAKDKFLTRLLLLNADKKRYGELIRDIENNHTRNIGGYPDTPTAAFDILVNYKPSRSRHVADEGGLSFYTDDQDEDNSTQPPQRCGTPGNWCPPAGGRGRGRSPGRGGRSGGRGRGRTSGRGQGGQCEVGSAPGEDNSHQQEAESDAGDAQYLLDNLDNNVNYYSYIHPAVDHLVATSSTQEETSLQGALLLDSCSTLNLFSDKGLLHDLHWVPKGVRVRCNAGIVTTNWVGRYGSFPEPVWLLEHGVINIPSFHLVAKHCDIWYDSSVADQFHIEVPGGKMVRFTPMAKGLYVCASPQQEDSTGWAFINLVDDRKQ